MARGRHGHAAQRPPFDVGDTSAGELAPDVLNEITWYMREHKVSRADLAGAMGVSTGRVSRILSGGETLTPRTLCGVLTALGARVEITLRPANEHAPA
ncbi:MAG TPA: helix-turn-helix domain-containing protein [Streptosporangiaceae bacterium]|jgi:transcriptional regulator with XRE-family HTH domain|nr:helix-turn-helix domain-containing protein [Streptosporangiaceae bacterium]